MQAESRSELADRVQKIVASLAEGGTFAPERPLAEAGFDSIGFAELALALEEDLGVRLADADLERLGTLAAVTDAAFRLQGAPAGPRLADGIGRYQAFIVRAGGPSLTRWYHATVTGREHVPTTGPAVVCANHNSLLDIPFLTMGVPRAIWFMAKVELFRGPGRWAFNLLGGFPVRRQINDLKAIDSAFAVLERGVLLGMFPEGTRSPRELLPFLPGAAWIALAKGVPLVPAAITGAAESLPRGHLIPKRTNVRVQFGEPIAVEREDDPARRIARAGELTAELRRRVETLFDRA